MNNLYKKTPIRLNEILNKFNLELSNYKKFVSLNFLLSYLQFDKKYEQISIKYIIKETDYYFEINFVRIKDYIDWNYYPNYENSSKITEQNRVVINENVYKDLEKSLKHWKNIIVNSFTIQNPMDFFSDRIIEFYADEVLNEVNTIDHENEVPLPSKKQGKALILLDKHKQFIEEEIKITKNNFEKISDLEIAKRNITEIQKDITRMTISEVKRKWAIAFGVIMKWSAVKFLYFAKLDKASGQDISRMIGSFIGGVFGIPKIE